MFERPIELSPHRPGEGSHRHHVLFKVLRFLLRFLDKYRRY